MDHKGGERGGGRDEQGIREGHCKSCDFWAIGTIESQSISICTGIRSSTRLLGHWRQGIDEETRQNAGEKA